MLPPFYSRSPDVIIAQHREALDWLTAIGFHIEGTRFERFADHLRVIEEDARQPLAARRRQWPKVQAAVVANHEALDLIRIYQYLSGLDRAVVARRLKRVRQHEAPDLYVDEEPESSGSRNFLAELSVAAVLAGSGFDVDISAETDVLIRGTFAEGAALVAVEVKRPQRVKQLAKRLSDGAEQVRRAFAGEIPLPKGERAHGGIVVLVLDKLYPFDAELLVPRPRDDFYPILEAKLVSWCDEHSRHLLAVRRPEVAALVVWWRTIGRLANNGGWAWTECLQHKVIYNRDFPVPGVVRVIERLQRDAHARAILPP